MKARTRLFLLVKTTEMFILKEGLILWVVHGVTSTVNSGFCSLRCLLDLQIFNFLQSPNHRTHGLQGHECSCLVFINRATRTMDLSELDHCLQSWGSFLTFCEEMFYKSNIKTMQFVNNQVCGYGNWSPVYFTLWCSVGHDNKT